MNDEIKKLVTESLDSKKVQSLCHMGEQALAMRDYAQAHHCFTEALKVNPQNKTALEGKIQSLVKWGDAACEAGEFDKAHHYYSIAMEMSRDDKMIRHKKEIAAQKIEELKGSGVTSVLFLNADPTDASRLRLGEELREIQEKLQLAKLREQFELHQRMSVRPADISQALLDLQPQIVHFSGHGMATGVLCFENQIGKTHSIQPEALAALFEQFASQVKCVVLNACYSEIQANAIAKHIDCVIGMNKSIGDRASIAFSVGFYQALGAGRTIEEAYRLGCVQIQLQGISEHLTPILIQKKDSQQLAISPTENNPSLIPQPPVDKGKAYLAQEIGMSDAEFDKELTRVSSLLDKVKRANLTRNQTRILALVVEKSDRFEVPRRVVESAAGYDYLSSEFYEETVVLEHYDFVSFSNEDDGCIHLHNFATWQTISFLSDIAGIPLPNLLRNPQISLIV